MIKDKKVQLKKYSKIELNSPPPKKNYKVKLKKLNLKKECVDSVREMDMATRVQIPG